MTEFEFFEATHIALTGLSTTAMGITTAVFAYVVAAYVAGNKLSRSAATWVSAIYTMFIVGPFMAYLRYFGIIQELIIQYHAAYPDGRLLDQGEYFSIYVALGVIPIISGWIASLLFIHFYIRKDTNDGSNYDT